MEETKDLKTKAGTDKKEKGQIDKIYIDAGLRILKCRNEKKVTRDTLAKAAGISSKFLYEIENGHTGFSVSVLERLSNALEVDYDYILYGRLPKQHYDENLIKAIAAFDNESLDKVIRILNILSEFR